jgi:hypothetical protein
MKKLSSLFVALCVCSSVYFFSCSKQGNNEGGLVKTTIYTPVYKTLTEVRADMKVTAPQPLEETGKIYTYGKYIFISEANKGIHIIDNTNPSRPKNTGFIAIPGINDIAVKDNYLYADSYADLIVFNISNPQNIARSKIIERVFPDKLYYYWGGTSPDSIKVVASFSKRDTLVEPGTLYRFEFNTFQTSSGSMSLAKASSDANGTGGSMARFTIVNDYMYTVSQNSLASFSVANPAEPVLKKNNNIGWGIETIYPFKDRLFIGSTSGMFVYDISTPEAPRQLGSIGHVQSCDPVVADEEHAFVTLRSGTSCNGFTNQLEVLDVKNLMQPVRLKVYSMTNPHGLAKDGKLLFICDGKGGLKLYDASNVQNLRRLDEVGSLDAIDVILQNKIAIVIAKDGLYQFNYNNPYNLQLISKIAVQPAG